jgi:non-canonical poly(A) RNA polymerase PAPD5/7
MKKYIGQHRAQQLSDSFPTRRRSRSRTPPKSPPRSDFIPLSRGLKPAAPPRPAPWVRSSTFKFDDPLLQLHEEIIDFYDYMQPSKVDLESRLDVISRMRTIATSLWPSSQLDVFGSYETGLWLPNSDIDIVISTTAGEEPTELINSFAHKVCLQNMASEMERILTAKVPILKMKDRATGIYLDVSFNIDNGLQGIMVVKEYLERYPEAKYIIFVVKYFLKQRGLNDTYSGGIGSFLLFCMVISALQHHPAHRQDRKYYSRYTLAHYLVAFFKLYGEDFNYEMVGISIKGEGRYFQKASKNWLYSEKPGLLAVECPQTDNDLGKNSFSVELAKKAFGHAYKILCAQSKKIALTPLNMIIRTDELIETRPAMHKE